MKKGVDVMGRTECASDASCDADTEGDHEHAATTVCFEAFNVPCRDCGGDEAIAQTSNKSAGDVLSE